MKIIIRGVFLIITSVVFLSGCTKSQQQIIRPIFNDHQIVTAQFGNSKKLNLEVVNTPQSISQGLSGRGELGADGMLFIYDKPRIPRFWMKEMEFDLDLVWIKDTVVIEITENVPSPDGGVAPDQLPTYSPKKSIDMVLEINAGNADDLDLSIGDTILFN